MANDLHPKNLEASQLQALYLRRLSEEQTDYPPETQVSEELDKTLLCSSGFGKPFHSDLANL